MQGTREEKKPKKQSTFKMDKNTSKHHIQVLIIIIVIINVARRGFLV